VSRILQSNVKTVYSHMKRPQVSLLNPRKIPAQVRSVATLDAILEAATQVLLASGFEKMSTTRIAERAGVSVGSFYQYFPNKRALLAALVQRHVSEVATRAESACQAVHGKTIREMCETIVNTFIDAKTDRADLSRALYLPSAVVGGATIVKAQSDRVGIAVAAMLETASDACFEQPALLSLVLVTAVVGPMQAVLEMGANPELIARLRTQLTALCVGYLIEAARHRDVPHDHD
jgi:AcrR family transcriptional regulator